MNEPSLNAHKSTWRYPRLYLFSALFFILALAGVCAVVAWDVIHGLRFTAMHGRLDAWPLSMIGLSYIGLQLGTPRDRVERIKGILLGLAFVLWGSEQLLPPSRWVTVMDELVVAIFVIDVSWIIAGHLKPADQNRRLP